jgi:hypothetical protein
MGEVLKLLPLVVRFGPALAEALPEIEKIAVSIGAVLRILGAHTARPAPAAGEAAGAADAPGRPVLVPNPAVADGLGASGGGA